ncbi:cold-shock protein [Amycolatopsis albispora]|uniref:CSD domain-containing protein n=1 Tax=Amycolatopsis albispora TaxID=1804986 RepID=A0A344L5D9_9PSEU|nr:cold shock domain-containing protein [Amycolatopsis albispora]AXB43263.1 hypothetical protein A4R43_12460 [Amycolatopsis albispora]
MTTFDTGAGEGSIRADDGGFDVFVCTASMGSPGPVSLRAGDRVSFELVRGPKGWEATGVRLLGSRRTAPGRRASPAEEERFRKGLRGAIDRQAGSRRRVDQRRARRRRNVVLTLITVALVAWVVASLSGEIRWLTGAVLFLIAVVLILMGAASPSKEHDKRAADNRRGWWGP